MLPNMCYPIPTIGRITIGHSDVNEKGEVVPVRRNHFRITALHKIDGDWTLHPYHKAVVEATESKIDEVTEIPVKMLFNDPDLIVRERYEAYEHGRLRCATCGKGQAKRAGQTGMDLVSCPGPDACAFARSSEQGCGPVTRINVQIDVKADVREDPLSTFILRTQGINTARAIRTKLEMMRAMFGGRLVGVPMLLKLRKKSTSISQDSPFYYVDLVLNASIIEAADRARVAAEELEKAGISQSAMEKAVKAGLSNGAFEDSIEESPETHDLMVSRSAMGKAPIIAFPRGEESLPSVVGAPEGGDAAVEAHEEPAPTEAAVAMNPSDPVGLDALRALLPGAVERQAA